MILQRSLTLRLTFLSTLCGILILSGLSFFINYAIENHFLKEDHFILKNKIEMIKDVIVKTQFKNDFGQILSKLEEHEGVVIKIDNPDNDVAFYISDNIHFPSSLLESDIVNYSELDKYKQKHENPHLRLISRPAQNDLLEWQDNGNLYRGMQVQLTSENTNHSSVLITLALNINHHTYFLKAFREILTKLTLLAVLITALLHWIITHRGLQPLKMLSKKAKLISGKDIKQRMPVDNLPVEIAGLSETLNNMLERLEKAFQQLENFSSDIAHELRTPINNLMMHTQVVLSKPRNKNEYIIALGSNIEEFERLARMISDMLFLAKADNDQLLLSIEVIDLEKEIKDLFEFYDALAEEADIQLMVQGKARVKGDKLMLRRAFSNLISNAIHHSFAGSKININIYTDEKKAILEVTNAGHTIPAETLPHLFERFYRANEARTSSSLEGVGLGNYRVNC